MAIPEVALFKPHPLRSLVEPLMEDVSYCEKSMFGCQACYIYGRMVVVLAFPGEEPESLKSPEVVAAAIVQQLQGSAETGSRFRVEG
jgi:hypothetical protein